MNDMKKIGIMEKVQLTYEDSLTGFGLFSKGKKKDFGVSTVVGAVKLVWLQRRSDVDPKGWKFYRIFYEYFINLIHNFRSLEHH